MTPIFKISLTTEDKTVFEEIKTYLDGLSVEYTATGSDESAAANTDTDTNEAKPAEEAVKDEPKQSEAA